jgi:hypothetical protein
MVVGVSVGPQRFTKEEIHFLLTIQLREPYHTPLAEEH